MTYQEISKLYRIPTEIVRQLSKVARHDQNLTLKMCDRYNLEYTRLPRDTSNDVEETIKRVIEAFS